MTGFFISSYFSAFRLSYIPNLSNHTWAPNLIKNKQSARSLTAFLVTWSFVVLTVNGIVLYVVPQGRIAYWVHWSLVGMEKEQWGWVHSVDGGDIRLVYLQSATGQLGLRLERYDQGFMGDPSRPGTAIRPCRRGLSGRYGETHESGPGVSVIPWKRSPAPMASLRWRYTPSSAVLNSGNPPRCHKPV